MSKQLQEKKDKCIAALNELHSDTSGPARDNLDAVREVIGEARIIEDALERDCEEPE